MTYLSTYVSHIYFRDHNRVLKEIGYEYTPKLDPITNEIIPCHYLNESEILDKTYLWIAMALFYYFSIMVFLSYFRLLFSDISFENYREELDLTFDGMFASIPDSFMCRKCNIIRGYYKKTDNDDENTNPIFVRRTDIVHCVICNVCSELHSHHNKILNVCICAKNYKFFILLLIYTSCLFCSFIASVILLNVGWKIN